MAEKGINEFMEVFHRDPENPLLANIIVVDGSPKEMMEYSLEFKDKPRPAFYVNDLLSDARKRLAIPETRVYNFSILNYSKTIDPAAPMLLNILVGRKGKFERTFEEELPDNGANKIKKGAAVLIKNTKSKTNINTNGLVPEIQLNVDVTGALDEFTGSRNLDDSEYKKKVEDTLAKSLQSDILKLLGYLQSVGSDPIGFGEMIRAKKNNYWKSVQWKDVYKDVVFNVDVKMNLESYGAIQ